MNNDNFKIGEWLVERNLGRLSSTRQTVRLEPQVMKVLVYLASRHGEVVTKDALIDTQWPTSVVSDAAVSRCISQIRSALGDDRQKPRYVETIPKVGYRLIAKPTYENAVITKVKKSRLAAAAVLASAALLTGAYFVAQPARVDALVVRDAEVLTNNADHNSEFVHAAGRVLTDRIRQALSHTDGIVRVADVDAPAPPASSRYELTSRMDATGPEPMYEFELSQSKSGRVIWRDTFTSSNGDVFDIACDVAEEMMDQFDAEAQFDKADFMAAIPSRNVLAYDAYLRVQKDFGAIERPILQNAIVLYERAIEEDPEFGLAYAMLSYSLELDARLWGGSRIDDAMQAAQRAIDLAPGQPESHYAFGRVRSHIEDREGALRSYRRALDLDPQHTVALYAIGEIYFYRREYAIAEDFWMRTVQSDPRSHHAMSALGQVYIKTGDLAEARFWLEKATREVPLQAHANSLIALLDTMNGEFELARSRCELVNRSFPENYQCLQVRALALELDGNWNAANQLLDHMRRLWPEDEFVLLGKARALKAQSQHEEAEAILDWVIAHSLERIGVGERSWYHRWTAAAAYALKGNHEQAISWLNEAAAAGRHDYLWDLTDPTFSELRGASEFEDYIAATRVASLTPTRLSARD